MVLVGKLNYLASRDAAAKAGLDLGELEHNLVDSFLIFWKCLQFRIFQFWLLIKNEQM